MGIPEFILDQTKMQVLGDPICSWCLKEIGSLLGLIP